MWTRAGRVDEYSRNTRLHSSTREYSSSFSENQLLEYSWKTREYSRILDYLRVFVRVLSVHFRRNYSSNRKTIREYLHEYLRIENTQIIECSTWVLECLRVESSTQVLIPPNTVEKQAMYNIFFIGSTKYSWVFSTCK